MVIPYYSQLEKKKITYELANLTKENARYEVSSTKINVKPAFLLPDGSLYYITTNHLDANFYVDFVRCLEELEKACIKPRFELKSKQTFNELVNKDMKAKLFHIYEDEIILEISNFEYINDKLLEEMSTFLGRKLHYKKMVLDDFLKYNPYRDIEYTAKAKDIELVIVNYNLVEYLKSKINYYISKVIRIKKDGLLAGDVREFMNYNCIPFYKFDPSFSNLYTDNCKDVILSIINSKIFIYSSFLNLLKEDAHGIKLKKALIDYPSKFNGKESLEDIIYLYDNIKELDHLARIRNIQDFVVRTFYFDKIETQVNRTITTSRININETFFNYLIMEFDVVSIPRIILNKDQNIFMKKISDNFIETATEKEYEDEIRLIKKYIPFNERYKYFK